MGVVEHPGDRIQYEMYKQGLCVTHLASHLRVSSSTIYSIVDKRYKYVSDFWMTAFSHALDVDKQDLFKPLSENELSDFQEVKKRIIGKYKGAAVKPKDRHPYWEKVKVLRKECKRHGITFCYVGPEFKLIDRKSKKNLGVSGTVDFFYSYYKTGDLESLLK